MSYIIMYYDIGTQYFSSEINTDFTKFNNLIKIKIYLIMKITKVI